MTVSDNTIETMHTPVFSGKLLSGNRSQEEVYECKLTLNLCQHAARTNQLVKPVWRTNQHEFSSRGYLDLNDWIHRVRAGDCGNWLGCCIDFWKGLGKPHNDSLSLSLSLSFSLSHTKINTQSYMIKLESTNTHTDRNTHTHQCEPIYLQIQMHTFLTHTVYIHNCSTHINIQTWINTHAIEFINTQYDINSNTQIIQTTHTNTLTLCK